jgi:hypothetical protein
LPSHTPRRRPLIPVIAAPACRFNAKPPSGTGNLVPNWLIHSYLES